LPRRRKRRSYSRAAAIPPRIGPIQNTPCASNTPLATAGPNDRAGFIDYHQPDLPAIRASRVRDLIRYYREEPATDARTWLHDLDAVSAWVEKIQRRGGRVVFFREPAADESLALDEANFPRDRYWDAYARRSPATMIDFRDVPEMTAFVLPDTSHIDATDVPRFTIALANLLKSRKLVD